MTLHATSTPMTDMHRLHAQVTHTQNVGVLLYRQIVKIMVSKTNRNYSLTIIPKSSVTRSHDKAVFYSECQIFTRLAAFPAP